MVKLTAFYKGRIEVIIPFEVPPVLLKYLGGLLEHCRLEWLNIGQLQESG
jgi:hypothetical protein